MNLQEIFHEEAKFFKNLIFYLKLMGNHCDIQYNETKDFIILEFSDFKNDTRYIYKFNIHMKYERKIEVFINMFERHLINNENNFNDVQKKFYNDLYDFIINQIKFLNS